MYSRMNEVTISSSAYRKMVSSIQVLHMHNTSFTGVEEDNYPAEGINVCHTTQREGNKMGAWDCTRFGIKYAMTNTMGLDVRIDFMCPFPEPSCSQANYIFKDQKGFDVATINRATLLE
jgi:hypothetical protein